MGICLGMQMLMKTGYEHKETPGLGIIQGDVIALPKDMPGFKVPNINWHQVYESEPGKWQNSLMQKTPNETSFYFVHSYFVRPELKSDVLAESEFGSLRFAAAVKKNNVSGTQFHPEKSGESGLLLLKNFLNE